MKRPNKKNKSRILKLNYFLCGVVILLIILQIVSFTHIFKLQKTINGIGSREVAELINSAEDERYKYPSIDVSENKVYIPEAQIYIPLNDTSRNIRYDFFDMKGLEQLYFSYTGIIGHQSDIDNPNCDKVLALSKTKQEMPDFTYVKTIVNNKYGLRYLYKHNSCQLYTSELTDAMIDAVSSAQPY